ncbi:MAG: hypothetical protein MJZ60_10725 [Bacteroidaceae bacterium]|nr:hypothetical protein [Bacteroidaceae bacterium]
MDKKARNFRNYKVWQDAVDYATEVYKITNGMPWLTTSSAIATRQSSSKLDSALTAHAV